MLSTIFTSLFLFGLIAGGLGMKRIKKSGTCLDDFMCLTTEHTRFVSSPADCYCLGCPTFATSEDVAEDNERSWHQHCDLAKMGCPAVRCMKPCESTCVGGGCACVNA